MGTAAECLTTAAVQVFLDFRGLHGCWRLRYEQLEIEMMKDSKAEHKQHRSNLGKLADAIVENRNFQRVEEFTRLGLFLVGTIDGPQTLSPYFQLPTGSITFPTSPRWGQSSGYLSQKTSLLQRTRCSSSPLPPAVSSFKAGQAGEARNPSPAEAATRSPFRNPQPCPNRRCPV